MRKILMGIVVAAVSYFLLQPLSAQAWGYPHTEDGMWAFPGNPPNCGDLNVLSRIARRFAYREAEFWQSPLTIQQFEGICEVALRPWGEMFIPRRFCTAKVLTSDGRWRVVNYSIRKGLGPIGLGNDVQWCVVGLDRSFVFAPACRAALP